ncbi:hypothetical protein, partial [Pseudomonas alloputida]
PLQSMHDAAILGPLRGPIATQGRSHRDRASFYKLSKTVAPPKSSSACETNEIKRKSPALGRAFSLQASANQLP